MASTSSDSHDHDWEDYFPDSRKDVPCGGTNCSYLLPRKARTRCKKCEIVFCGLCLERNTGRILPPGPKEPTAKELANQDGEVVKALLELVSLKTKRIEELKALVKDLTLELELQKNFKDLDQKKKGVVIIDESSD